MNYRGTIAYRAGVGGMVEAGFCASLVSAWDFLIHDIQLSDLKYPRFHFMQGLSCMLHDSANQIAEGFLGEWVIFLDTDHVFQSDALLEMVLTFEENELDILTGFTQKRQPPYTPLIYETTFDPLQNFEPIIPKGLDRQTLIPINSSGLACLMVRRKVFEDIKKCGELPFDMRSKFNTTDLLTGDSINSYSKDQLPEGRRLDEHFWEDVSFFWRAKMLGYKSFCAPWIKFFHIEKRLVTESLINAPVPRDPRIPV